MAPLLTTAIKCHHTQVWSILGGLVNPILHVANVGHKDEEPRLQTTLETVSDQVQDNAGLPTAHIDKEQKLRLVDPKEETDQLVLVGLEAALALKAWLGIQIPDGVHQFPARQLLDPVKGSKISVQEPTDRKL